MKLSMSSDELTRGLGRVAGIVDPKSSLPILGNILLRAEKGVITVTGSDIFQRVVSESPADVDESGTVAIPAKMFVEVVRSLSEARVSLSDSDRHYISLVSGSAKFKLTALSGDEYPPSPIEEKLKMVPFDGAILLRAIQATEFACSSDDNRPMLKGAFLEGAGKGLVRLTATNGAQLATIEAKLGKGFALEKGIILARRGISGLKKLLEEAPEADMQIGFAEKYWRWTRGGISMISGYQEGTYPDFRNAIPKIHTGEALLVRETLINLLKRVSILTAHRGSEVRIVIDGGILRIDAQSAENGEAAEEMPAEATGSKFEGRFSADKLLAILSTIEVEQVVLETGPTNDPLVMKPAGDATHMGMCMPFVD